MSRKGARGWLEERGYPSANGMEKRIEAWMEWHTAKHDWYKIAAIDTLKATAYSRTRATMKPARTVVQEWASLLLNERTTVTVDSGGSEEQARRLDEWTQEWMDRTRFMLNAQELVEQAFAVGTGALVLKVTGALPGVASSTSDLGVIRFSGADIIPISYEDRVCTEAAFIGGTNLDGVQYEQLIVITRDNGGDYVSEPHFFDKDGKEVILEGFEAVRHGKTQPFAIIRTGLANTYDPHSPMGVSVYDDAIDAIKQVDRVFDNAGNDFELGGKMLFMHEEMLRRDEEGNYIIPQSMGQSAFMIGENDHQRPFEYNPDLRVDQNERALSMALSILSLKCGLGEGYLSIDRDTGGIKTATEVISEDSDLFRNIRKHENVMAPALETLIRAAIETANLVAGAGLPDPRAVTVQFDDSIIEDTDAMKRRDREDVSAGLMAPWEYRMKWMGEDEAIAQAAIAEIVAFNQGSAIPMV